MLIAFETYRTETLQIKGETFTVTFTKRKDGEEYAVFAVNDSGSKRWRAFYTSETADDFNTSTGQQLADEVLKVLQSDVSNGLI